MLALLPALSKRKINLGETLMAGSLPQLCYYIAMIRSVWNK